MKALNITFRYFTMPGFLMFALWGLFATGREAWEHGGKQRFLGVLSAAASVVSSTSTAILQRARNAWDALSSQQPPTMPWRW